MFNKDRLALLEKQFPNRSFFFLATVDSTNAFAKKMEISSSKPTVILAFEQSSGAGQRTNKWYAEAGKNLTFTIADEPPTHFNTQHYLLAVALGIAKVLKQHLKIDCQIKWPNDILVDRKKIAGILVEAIFEGNNFKSLITGIGLNVNQVVFPNELVKAVSSLKLELGIKIDLLDLLAKLLNSIDYHTKESSEEYYTLVFKQVNEMLAYKNEVVEILVNRKESFLATIIGIDDNGALWIRDEQENFRKFMNEQISITPITEST